MSTNHIITSDKLKHAAEQLEADGHYELSRDLLAILERQAPNPLLTLNVHQLRNALDFAGGDPDSLDAEISLQRLGEATSTDGDPAPAGLYAWFTDLPEEGSIHLDDSQSPVCLEPTASDTAAWPKLDKAALVGANFRFGAGVSARFVVEAAQRHFENEVTPEKESDRISKAKALFGAIAQMNATPPDEQDGPWREAVLDALATSCADMPTTATPRQVLSKVLECTFNEAELSWEVAGWQQRYLDPVEGPTIWTNCDKHEYELHKDSERYDVREVFHRSPLPAVL